MEINEVQSDSLGFTSSALFRLSARQIGRKRTFSNLQYSGLCYTSRYAGSQQEILKIPALARYWLEELIWGLGKVPWRVASPSPFPPLAYRPDIGATADSLGYLRLRSTPLLYYC